MQILNATFWIALAGLLALAVFVALILSLWELIVGDKYRLPVVCITGTVCTVIVYSLGFLPLGIAAWLFVAFSLGGLFAWIIIEGRKSSQKA